MGNSIVPSLDCVVDVAMLVIHTTRTTFRACGLCGVSHCCGDPSVPNLHSLLGRYESSFNINSHKSSDHTSGPFPPDVPTKIVFAYLVSPIRVNVLLTASSLVSSP
jgi:hypothetical protein